MDAMMERTGTHMSEADVTRMVGARVRQARILAGLQAAKLASLIGVSRVMQYRYESGAAPIGIWLLPRYATVTEKPIAWFFEDLMGADARLATQALDGTTARLTPAVVEAVRLFAALSNGRQDVVLSTMRAVADSKAG